MAIFHRKGPRGDSLCCAGIHEDLRRAFARANPELRRTNEWMQKFCDLFADYPEDSFTIPESMKYEDLVKWKEAQQVAEAAPTMEVAS